MAHFYVHAAGEIFEGRALPLDPASAHHLMHVLRVGPGDRITVFNGCGTRADCLLRSHANGTVEAIPGPVEVVPQPRLRPHLLQGLPQRAAMDGIVRRATELGVWEIHPIACRCGDGGLGAEKFANRTERWRTVAVSACRQSHNPFLPAVHPPQRLERVPLPSSAVKLAACLGEDALPWRELLRRFPENSVAGDLYLAVGPEGDFTGDEWAWLRAGGFSPVSLGPRILTAETAALALLSAAQLAWGE